MFYLQLAKSNDYFLLTSLKQRNWEIAKAIAANNASDRTCASLFQAVETFLDPFAGVEIALSFAHLYGLPEVPMDGLSISVSRAVTERTQCPTKGRMKSVRILRFGYSRHSLLAFSSSARPSISRRNCIKCQPSEVFLLPSSSRSTISGSSPNSLRFSPSPALSIAGFSNHFSISSLPPDPC